MIPLPGNGLPANHERGQVLSGIIFINRNGLCLCNAPKEHGPPKSLYSCWTRLSNSGVVARMMIASPEAAVPRTVMIDGSRHAPLVRACLCNYLNTRRTATSLRSKKGARRPEGASDRSHKGRLEHQAACRHRCRWAPDPLGHDRGPPLGDASIVGRATRQGLHGCCRFLRQLTEGGVVAGLPGLRCRRFRGALNNKG